MPSSRTSNTHPVPKYLKGGAESASPRRLREARIEWEEEPLRSPEASDLAGGDTAGKAGDSFELSPSPRPNRNKCSIQELSGSPSPMRHMMSALPLSSTGLLIKEEEYGTLGGIITGCVRGSAADLCGQLRSPVPSSLHLPTPMCTRARVPPSD